MPMTWEEKIAHHKNRSETIVNNIIRQIEEGVGEWKMPWHKGLPQAKNRITGKFYGGKNMLILWDECLNKGYSQNVWATLRQWNQFNSGIKRGESGTLVKFVVPQDQLNKFDQLDLEFADDEKDDIDGFRIFFHYLFNVDQVTNNRAGQIGLFDNQGTTYEIIDEFIERTKAKIIHGGNRAFYHIYTDQITMPPKAAFMEVDGTPALENYYSTLLHELIHWTGHPDRCDRSLINRRGRASYAFEELIAELGTAILSTQFRNQVVPRLNHAEYVNNWLAVLKHDFKYFLQALELARTAIHWLYEHTRILPYPVPIHYNRTVDNDLLTTLNSVLQDSNSDLQLSKILEYWDQLDGTTRSKILTIAENGVKR
jgi:antirestriction protein ArdC